MMYFAQPFPATPIPHRIGLMKENLTYIFIALVALFMAGYSVHMIIGGMVSKTTERGIIGGVLVALVVVMSYMAKDLAKRKKGD